MAEQSAQSKGRQFWPARFWVCVLDLALVLWVARVPACFVALGFLLLWKTPQAQDLFVGLAQDYKQIPLFLLLLFVIWAMPTHFAARLLIDTDGRLSAHSEQQRLQTPSRCLETIERWVPRFLGLLTFPAILIAIG